MTNLLRHFEIEAEDVERAKRFYESVFGWAIRPWGPPNYYLIDAGAGMSGDIRERTSATGPGNAGFVCTIVVDDLQAIKQAVTSNGGTIVVPPGPARLCIRGLDAGPRRRSLVARPAAARAMGAAANTP